MGLVVVVAGPCDLGSLTAAWPAVLVGIHRRRLGEQEAGRATYLVATLDGAVVGVGTALLRAVEDHAHRRDLACLAVSVDVDQGARARALYRRLGYEPTGVSDTCTYRGVADDGVERTFTKTSELMVLAGGLCWSGTR